MEQEEAFSSQHSVVSENQQQKRFTAKDAEGAKKEDGLLRMDWNHYRHLRINETSEGRAMAPGDRAKPTPISAHPREKRAWTGPGWDDLG